MFNRAEAHQKKGLTMNLMKIASIAGMIGGSFYLLDALGLFSLKAVFNK